MAGWYIRTRDSRVQGPFAVDAVRGWIASGRVRPDMEFSTDGKNWSIGRDCHELFGSVKKSSGVGEPVKVRTPVPLSRRRNRSRYAFRAQTGKMKTGTLIISCTLLVAVGLAVAASRGRSWSGMPAWFARAETKAEFLGRWQDESIDRALAKLPFNLHRDPIGVFIPIPDKGQFSSIQELTSIAVAVAVAVSGRDPDNYQVINGQVYLHYECSDGTIRLALKHVMGIAFGWHIDIF